VIPDRKITRALVVVAHPDDVDFWAGGTVASSTSAGIAVAYCVFTDGDSGGFGPRIPRSAIPDIRRDEQKAAALELGVDDVRFLGKRCRDPMYCGRFRGIPRRRRQRARWHRSAPRKSAEFRLEVPAEPVHAGFGNRPHRQSLSTRRSGTGIRS
jgi:LmbE family N-acetylglucosaminyl deacetylase